MRAAERTPDRLRLAAFGRAGALVVAEREGLFAAESIAVECTLARDSGSQIGGLLAGELDVIHTAVDNVVLRVDRDGADLAVVLVAELGVAQRLVVRAEIRSVDDLRGRDLAVDSADSGYATLLYAMLTRRGLPRESYRVVPVGGTPLRMRALVEGRVAGAMLGPPSDRGAIAAGARVLLAAAEEFPGYPALTVVTRRSWAAEHADLLSRYCRALLAGERAAADPGRRERLIALVAADAGVSPDDAAAQVAAEAASREVAAPTVAQTRAAISRVVALRHGGPPPDVDAYFDPRYALAADPALA